MRLMHPSTLTSHPTVSSSKKLFLIAQSFIRHSAVRGPKIPPEGPALKGSSYGSPPIIFLKINPQGSVKSSLSILGSSARSISQGCHGTDILLLQHITATEQSPSLLAVILDTNPAAWSLLSQTLPLSSAVANLLVFINAHLAANYTNKVAVIASHCDKATWLYPSPTEQKLPRSISTRAKRQPQDPSSLPDDNLSDSAKRLKLNGPAGDPPPPSSSANTGSKYRPFRLVEEELLRNLTSLLSSTSPDAVAGSPSTMIAGAFTLALSYINRESILLTESLVGSSSTNAGSARDPTAAAAGEGATQSLQSRILLISASPSTDLAHQYIPIMNAIFACQRLSIPIDILQLPLPTSSSSSKATGATSSTTDPSSTSTSSSTSNPNSRSHAHSNSTVFLQQAADATHGIFIPAHLSSPNGPNPAKTASQSLLTYLLTSFLSSPLTRAAHLILPTRIDVDFRAACFCHRNVVSVGFVCSICLSIFCEPPENGDCLTCGTHLAVDERGYGKTPVVVAASKSKKKRPQQQATAAR
ncbi:uncharacterized protein Z520_00868 [Fonsecaea multimorphosa CBS 102226]|uniref:General transcription and DNA repair factor IIH subunit TFB4 n=1 Tax=Fonsecaea multimorphosa CBS 102226 TaxID=1442371 RepID=A0A0D2HQP3_9EURO|nr:uncharacterized protein Z520_00868 [Fonsecaea multimorphosa CBS 102226]KIY04176.1 hypothetical protein Z520_00868 [Fonsecaea multimorphosa CBS 102226]OAL32005.1 hypothetical protein AYO22_00875 [Fonsecaea multimorphosa]